MLGNHLFRDVLRSDALTGDILHCPCQFPTAGVGEGDNHRHSSVYRGAFHAFGDASAHSLRQSLYLAYHAETDVVLHEYLFLELCEDEIHQSLDFSNGTVPVFCTESIERQIFDAESRGFFGDAFHGSHAFHMSCCAGQTFGLSPAPVATHDDGYMFRYMVQLLHFLNFGNMSYVTKNIRKL